MRRMHQNSFLKDATASLVLEGHPIFWHLARSLHARLHSTVRHGHAVRVHLLMCKGSLVGILHAREELADALRVTDVTVLVRNEYITQLSNLLVQCRHLRIQRVILSRIHFHFGLKVGKPLLLTLTTLEGGDSVNC